MKKKDDWSFFTKSLTLTDINIYMYSILKQYPKYC